MSAEFSLSHFPPVENAQVLPWGCMIQPFFSNDKLSVPSITASEIARCAGCFAYMNPFCKFNKNSWSCSLCKHNNSIASDRYLHAENRCELPELNSSIVEYEMESLSSFLPSYVFLVDCTAGLASIKQITKAILQAIIGLPEYCLIGLAIYSDRIGLFDLRFEIPEIKHILISENQNEWEVNLETIQPLNQFLVKQSIAIHTIETALDSLICFESDDNRRGFGSSIFAFVNYLLTSEENIFVKMICFISGIPNFGLGALHLLRHNKELSTDALLVPQSTFYLDMAGIAATNGISFDLHCFCGSDYTDLASLSPLVSNTGGHIFLHQTNSLVQDMQKSLQIEHVFDGLLRIRTSHEFVVKSVFSNFSLDDVYDGVYRCPVVDRHAAFCVEFDLVDRTKSQEAALQIAFIYNTVYSDWRCGCKDSANQRTDMGQCERCGKRFILFVHPVRRLRVSTFLFSSAQSYLQLYTTANLSVVFAILTHKAISISRVEGLSAARSFLQRWLGDMLVNYNQRLSLRDDCNGPRSLPIDMFLVNVPNLSLITRLVFALIASPLLCATSFVPDNATYMQCMCRDLAPDKLSAAVYYTLWGYADENTLTHTAIYLNHFSLNETSCSIALLVTPQQVVVLYRRAALEAGLPCPPSSSSLLGQHIDSCLAHSPYMVPKVTIMREDDDHMAFLTHLIEDNGSGGRSYDEFLQMIREDVVARIGS